VAWLLQAAGKGVWQFQTSRTAPLDCDRDTRAGITQKPLHERCCMRGELSIRYPGELEMTRSPGNKLLPPAR
jgi:hypothetical protein